MAGFVWQVIKEGGRHGGKYLAQGAAITATQAPKFIKPAGDFARGVVRGAPKYIPIGGESTGTTATITASLRAGMQTRYIATEVAKKVVYSGPRTAVGVAKYIAKTAVGDVVRPIQVPIYIGHEVLKIFPRATGYVGRWEKYTDPIMLATNRFLATIGAAPTIRGVVGTGIRGGAAIAIIKGVDTAQGVIDAAHSRATNYLRQAHEAANAYGGSQVTAQPAPGNYVVPVGGTPVANHQPVPPSLPAAPPVRPSPSSLTRRYIPSGGQ